MPAAGPDEERLGDGIHRLLHIDDPLRLNAYRDWLRTGAGDPRILTSLLHTLWTSNKPATLRDAFNQLRQHPAIVDDLIELMDLLEARADHLPIAFDGAPLSIHSKHSMNDILAAFRIISEDKIYQSQAGVYYHEPSKTDLFFVTLEKSERDYSPKTLYKDYAISPTLFHWQSQHTTSQASPTGQRYLHQRTNGTNVLLFVRQRRAQDGLTAPYTFLGPADYCSHQGDRPIAIVWELRHPMPADFFRQAKVAAG